MMWLAHATYADGTEYKELFPDSGEPDHGIQTDLEEMLVTRQDDCTWYSVVWVEEGETI